MGLGMVMPGNGVEHRQLEGTGSVMMALMKRQGKEEEGFHPNNGTFQGDIDRRVLEQAL